MYVGASFVAHSESSELIEPGDRSLDDPADRAQRTAVFRVASGDEGLDAHPAQRLAVRFGVVAPVRVEFVEPIPGRSRLARDRRHVVDQLEQLRHIVNIGAREPHDHGQAVAVGEHMAFGAGFTAVRGVRAGQVAPPTARTDPLSTMAFDQSIWSAARSSPNNA